MSVLEVAAAACLINEIGVVRDATSCRRASASDSPRAVSRSASRLQSSMFSMIARSVPLVIGLVAMGFHSIPWCGWAPPGMYRPG